MNRRTYLTAGCAALGALAGCSRVEPPRACPRGSGCRTDVARNSPVPIAVNTDVFVWEYGPERDPLTEVVVGSGERYDRSRLFLLANRTAGSACLDTRVGRNGRRELLRTRCRVPEDAYASILLLDPEAAYSVTLSAGVTDESASVETDPPRRGGSTHQFTVTDDGIRVGGSAPADRHSRP